MGAAGRNAHESPGRRDGSVAREQDDAQLVFISYAREDEEWRRRFEVMLAPLGERGVAVWSDEQISTGAAWRRELEQAIRCADVALVLVSPDLLASEFVMRTELPALQARGIPLAFVHVRASLALEAGVFTDVQWAHDLRRPLAGAADPDGEIVRICEKVATLLRERAASMSRETPVAKRTRATRPLPRTAGAGKPGRLHGVPPAARGEIERDELAEVRAALLGEGVPAVGITGGGRAVGLYGQGGIGKTVLAAALARDEQVRRHFPDGLYWVTLGERGDVVALQLALLEQLAAAQPALRSREATADALRATLAGRRCLLVVDDVWSISAAAAFDVTDALGRVLYTTRDERVLAAVGASVRRVDVLSEAAARSLLSQLSGQPIDSLPEAVGRVLGSTRRVALALALVGAAVGRGRRTWEDVAADLERADRTFLEHPYADVFKAMQVGVGALDARLAAAYLTLAAYPEDERVPVAAIARLWNQINAADNPAETRTLLNQLNERELLVLGEDTIAFHDLQHEFLLLRAGDLRLVHGDVLAAYERLLPRHDLRWDRLPLEEPYIWEHLLRHLREAGAPDAVRSLITDLAFLAMRCLRDGPYAVETDLRNGATLYPDEPAISWAIDLFTRWGHLFAACDTRTDIAAAIAIRAVNPPAPVDIERLRTLTAAPLVVPRWGLERAPNALLRTFTGHSGPVRAVAFSPDGNRIASASNDGTLRLWQPAHADRATTLEGHGDSVCAVAFSPDGARLASASADGTVRLWDPSNSRLITALRGRTKPVNAVAFSFDGDRLASAGDDGTVRLWAPGRSQPIATLRGHSGPVNAVAFAPNGARLASGGDDETVRIWDPARGILIATLRGHAYGVNSVCFSPNSAELASAGDDGTVRVWALARGRSAISSRAHSGRVTAVTYARSGMLASAGADGTVRLWTRARALPDATLSGHASPANAVAFSPDGTKLASAGDDGAVRFWSLGRVRRADNTPGISTRVNALAFIPDGTRLAGAGDDGTVRIWTSRGHAEGALKGLPSAQTAVVYSSDGTQLAGADEDGTIRIWRVADSKLIARLARHDGRVNAVAFSPDGKLLASAGNDRTVRIWRLAEPEPIAILDRHDSRVNAVAFSPDGKLLASAGNDGTVRIWTQPRWRQLVILNARTNAVHALAFSPDGMTLATADRRTVWLWKRKGRSWGRPILGVLRSQRLANARLAAGSRPDSLGFTLQRTLVITSGDMITLWDSAGPTRLCAARTGVAITSLACGPRAIAVSTNSTVAYFDIVDGLHESDSPEGLRTLREAVEPQ